MHQRLVRLDGVLQQLLEVLPLELHQVDRVLEGLGRHHVAVRDVCGRGRWLESSLVSVPGLCRYVVRAYVLPGAMLVRRPPALMKPMAAAVHVPSGPFPTY